MEMEKKEQKVFKKGKSYFLSYTYTRQMKVPTPDPEIWNIKEIRDFGCSVISVNKSSGLTETLRDLEEKLKCQNVIILNFIEIGEEGKKDKRKTV